MRLVALAAVAAALTVIFAAPAAQANDPQIRHAITYWFDRIRADYASANACHGCPDGADLVVSDGKQCMNALNAIRYYNTIKMHVAAANAFEACRYYALFAISWETSYSDVDTQQQTDDFALAKSQLARARLYARRVAAALGLSRYP